MKKLLGIVVLSLLLSGCAGAGEQSSLLGGVILLVGGIIALTIVRPFFGEWKKLIKLKVNQDKKLYTHS